MAQVTLSINGRTYPIACDDGQEEHLLKLSNYLDQRVSELASSMGQIGDARLLLMAGLLVSDELSDALADNETLRLERDALAKRAPPRESEDGEAEAIEALAARLETIADKLEQA